MGLVLRSPFGGPVAWADVSLNGDGLVVSCRRLGQATPGAAEDFLLCVVADRAVSLSGSSGSGASELALATFCASFLASDDVDVLWRLRDGVKAADARLAASSEGRVLSTLTALFVASDGTAYGVSVGDSPLMVSAPRPAVRVESGVQTLGHERSTALGTGETLPRSQVGGEGTIEQWWPNMEGDGTRTRLEPDTLLVLRRNDGSTSDFGGIALRFHGGQVAASQLIAQAGWLVRVVGAGFHGSGACGLACLAAEGALPIASGLLGAALDLGDGKGWSDEGLEQSFRVVGGDLERTQLAMVAGALNGTATTFASGGASVERGDGRLFTLRLGSEADPLDRGIPIEFEEDAAPVAMARAHAKRRGAHWLARLWRKWRRR